MYMFVVCIALLVGKNIQLLSHILITSLYPKCCFIKISLGVGSLSTSLLGRIEVVWRLTEDNAQLVNNLITGSAPLYIGGFEVLISQTPL